MCDHPSELTTQEWIQSIQLKQCGPFSVMVRLPENWEERLFGEKAVSSRKKTQVTLAQLGPGLEWEVGRGMFGSIKTNKKKTLSIWLQVYEFWSRAAAEQCWFIIKVETCGSSCSPALPHNLFCLFKKQNNV